MCNENEVNAIHEIHLRSQYRAEREMHINITDASLESINISEIKIERQSAYIVAHLTTQHFILLRRYYSGKTRTVCYMQWPDGKYPTSVADYVYVNNFQLQFIPYKFIRFYIFVGNSLINSKKDDLI